MAKTVQDKENQAVASGAQIGEIGAEIRSFCLKHPDYASEVNDRLSKMADDMAELAGVMHALAYTRIGNNSANLLGAIDKAT